MNGLALVGANLLFGVTGVGLLTLVGAVRTPRDLARLGGAALLVGIAFAGAVGGIFLPLGAPVWWLIVLVPTAAAIGGLWRLRAAGRVTEPFSRPGRRAGSGALRLLTGALAGVTVLVGALALWALHHAPLEEYDGWALWGMKARALAALGRADPAVFASPAYSGAHLEYPLGLPFITAVPVTLAGSFDSNLVVMQTVVIGVAGIAALWSLLRDRVRPIVLWAWLAAIAATPAVTGQLWTGYGDIPLAAFVAAGVVCVARFVEEGRTPHLLLTALFLVAAALSKNEGVLFAAAAMLAAFAVGAGVRRQLAWVGACMLVPLVPWQLWTSSHDLRTSDYELSTSFDPGYVLGRLGRVRLTLDWFGNRVLRTGDWTPLPLVTLATVAAALLVSRSRTAVVAALFIAVSFAGLAWIYLISPLGVDDYLDSNGVRVIASIVLGAAALGPVIVEDMLGPPASECAVNTRPAPRSRREWFWR